MQNELIRERRHRSIRNLWLEAIANVLKEQEPAAAAPPEQPAPEPLPEPPSEDTTPKQFTVDDMIEILNSIRGGRSFSDPEIYGRLVTFFKGLSDQQKVDLDQLLTEIAELITGAAEPQTQQKPSGPTATTQGSPPVGGAPQAAAPMPGAVPSSGGASVTT